MQQTPVTAMQDRSAATSDSRLYLPVALVDVSQPLGCEASHCLLKRSVPVGESWEASILASMYRNSPSRPRQSLLVSRRALRA